MTDIYIVGAHSRSKTLGIYLKTIDPSIAIKAYIITNQEPNPQYVDGVPVLHVDAAVEQFDTGLPVYIGTRGVYHEEICRLLENLGFATIVPVTPEYDNCLRNMFLRIYMYKQGKRFTKFSDIYEELCFGNGNNISSIIESRIYVIRSIHDAVLNCNIINADYEVDLQVGAALTNERICEYNDLNQDSISGNNVQYCELTGLYWMWKNTTDSIIGLEHYRRRFVLPDNWAYAFETKEVDVILPTPLYVHPSLRINYEERHISEDMNVLMSVYKNKHPGEYEAFETFMNGGIYSPCNMFIMRKTILDKYCEWLFPILSAVTDEIGNHDDTYQNRYPGFMAERLMSFYFDLHKYDYKTVYCDKSFLS